MRVIAEKTLLITLFAEIQKVALEKGGCHYGDYDKWCVSGAEIEQAIKNLFAENDVFKPTIDIDLKE